jgi:hypothetical protein
MSKTVRVIRKAAIAAVAAVQKRRKSKKEDLPDLPTRNSLGRSNPAEAVLFSLTSSAKPTVAKKDRRSQSTPQKKD